MNIRKLFLPVAILFGVALWLVRRVRRGREAIDWKDARYPSKLVTVDGVTLHYVEGGHGPHVILIHGFGGNAFSFRHMTSGLAETFRLVAIDLKGFGYSQRPKGGDYSLTEQARLMLRVMDALGIDRASLVGHSMGGEVVMRMALLAPERVERIVLAASVSGDRIPTLPPTPLLRWFMPLIMRFISRRLWKRLFRDPRKATPEVREAYLAPGRIRGSLDAVYELAKDLRDDRRIDYARITQPVLVLWADGERVLPKWVLGRLRQHFPKAEVVTIHEAGHLLLEEQPHQCNEAIRRFLTGRQWHETAGALAETV